MSGAGTTVAKISVKVSPDTRRFGKELRRDLERIEKSASASVEVSADFDGSGAKAKLRGLLADLQAQADANQPKIRPQVDMSPLQQLKGLGAGLSSSVANFGSSLSAGGIVTLIAALGVVAPAVAVVSGALAAIPGVLAGIAAPIGAIALGLDGIKQAASVLAPEFEALKASVSDVFARSLLPVFEQLRSIFPALTAGMQQVAAGTSAAFGGIVSGLTSESGIKSLSTIFQSIGDALATAAPGLTSFTEGLLKMAADVAALFPGVSEWFNQIAGSFNSFMTTMTTAGADGVTPLQQAMKGLGEILASIGPLIGDVFTKGLELLRDPAFIASVTGFVENIRAMVGPMLAVLGALTALSGGFTFLREQVSAVTGIFSTIGSVISAAFSAAVSVVQGGVSAITGAISSGFQSLVGIVASAWSAVVGAIQTGIAQAVAAVQSFGGQVVAACADFGSLLVSAGADLIRGLIEGIKSMAGAAVQAARDVGSAAVNAVKSLLGINSPSTVFAEIGVFVGEGFANGLLSQQDHLASTAKAIAGTVSEEFKAGMDMSIPDAGSDPFVQAASGLMNAPVDFAKATGKQFLTDLGISGNGMISRAVTEGINYVFQIGSVDEALSIKDREDSKQAMSVVGRV